MRKSRYSDEQIMRILREADKNPVPDVAKRRGVSEQSIYGWRKRLSDMAADRRQGVEEPVVTERKAEKTACRARARH